MITILGMAVSLMLMSSGISLIVHGKSSKSVELVAAIDLIAGFLIGLVSFGNALITLLDYAKQ